MVTAALIIAEKVTLDKDDEWKVAGEEQEEEDYAQVLQSLLFSSS